MRAIPRTFSNFVAGPILFTAPGAPPPGALARALRPSAAAALGTPPFALARAQGCRDLCLRGLFGRSALVSNDCLLSARSVQKCSFFLLLLALFCCAARLSATVLLPADLGDLSRDARAIALGRVVAVDGRWADDRRSIETLVTLDVDAYLKGSLGSTLQFRVPGGELGRYRSILVGAPEFVINQRLVVFLGARGPGVPYVLGLSQGVFRLVAASDGSGWLVTPPPVMPAVASTARVVRGDVTRRPMPLADFEQQVRALVGAYR